MAYDNYCIKAYNKMKSTWKTINIETGRSVKRDDTQYITDKAHGPHVAETINEYFLSLADNLANLAEILHWLRVVWVVHQIGSSCHIWNRQ
jgi:hypothetical protein